MVLRTLGHLGIGAAITLTVLLGIAAGCTLKQWLNPAVTKPEDRALFGLDE